MYTRLAVYYRTILYIYLPFINHIYLCCVQIRALAKHAILSAKGKTIKSIIQIAISLLQSLSPNLILTRRVCEDSSGLSTLLFWICGDILIHLVYQHRLSFETPHLLASGAHPSGHYPPMTDRSSSASETPGRQSLLTSSTVTGGGLNSTHNMSNNSEMMNRKMVSMTRNRPHSWHNWSSRIRQAIQSTLLTPQEFFGKVSRLKHTLMMRNSTTLSEATEHDDGHAVNQYSGGYDTVRSHMTTSPDNTGRGRSGSTADGMIFPVRRHSLSTVAMKSLTAQIGNFSNSSHNITSNAMNTAATDLEQIAKAMYRLKHTLIGFQYLLHITLIESKDITLTVSHANGKLYASLATLSCYHCIYYRISYTLHMH